jgi:RNA polymerase sigma-70 factor (ECF subfamily)
MSNQTLNPVLRNAFDGTAAASGLGARVGVLEPWDWAEVRLCCVREAGRVLRRPSEAEDAAQEALLRAWVHRARCLDAQRPLPWVARIARNEALRWHAREVRRQESALDEDAQDAVAGDVESADAAASRVDVERAVATLPRVDRELVRLRYVEDLTQEETASRLGIPEGTAKVRLHRLRTRLRDALDERS